MNNTIPNLRNREKQIVSAARTYVGVPFRHQGRSRLGLDCLGLLVCVARDCELRQSGRLLSEWDELGYGHFPSAAALSTGLEAVLQRADEVAAGCVLQFHIDGHARHLGVAANHACGELSLIHAYAPAKAVVEHRLDELWQQKIAAIWQVEAD